MHKNRHLQLMLRMLFAASYDTIMCVLILIAVSDLASRNHDHHHCHCISGNGNNFLEV
jgi:hypothetical protein